MAFATCTTLEDTPGRAAPPLVCLMAEASKNKTQDTRSCHSLGELKRLTETYKALSEPGDEVFDISGLGVPSMGVL
jgi:hypothetical protein